MESGVQARPDLGVCGVLKHGMEMDIAYTRMGRDKALVCSRLAAILLRGPSSLIYAPFEEQS